MASKTSISNMALGRIGVSQFVENVDTEKSTEAIQCLTYYDHNVEFVLRAFDWPFATGYRALGLVSEDPSSDWEYAFRYPTDALKVRRVVTSLGRSDPNPPPFVVGQDSQGPLIYTDEKNVTVEYTVRVTDPGRFDPLFIDALAWKLAADIAPALSRIKGARDDAMRMFAMSLNISQTIVANEQQREPERESEFVTARE